MKTEIIFNKQPTDNTVYKEKVFDVILSGGSPQGLSAYQLAVKNGFQGTEQEWLESLISPAIQLRITGTAFEWKYADEEEWKELIKIKDLNYEEFDNLPKINNIKLIGNLTSADLGLSSKGEGVASIIRNGTIFTVTRPDGTIFTFNQKDNVIESISVNGTTASVVNKNVDITVPTAVSQLQNDNNYATQQYVDSGIDSLAASVPTKVSDLTNDSEFTTKTYVDGEISTIEAAIPTKVSQLQNDSSYATTTYVNGEISGVRDEMPTKLSDLDNDTAFINQSQLSAGLETKQDVLPFTTPTNSDIGKALMPKTISNGEVTEWEFGEAGMVDDVVIDGVSIVNNKVAQIPVASSTVSGTVKVANAYGLQINSTGYIALVGANDSQCQSGSSNFRSITPSSQHSATFYGLAKAAGDTTQSASANAVGTYTDSAKTAIQSMLGIDSAIADAVGQITGFDFSIVQELPSTGTKGIIYLVAHSHGSNDGYDEYIWINNGFEKLGHTDIDLSDYATISYVDSELEGKVDDVQVNGTSIVNNGVANVPMAGANTLGVVRTDNSYGIAINQNNNGIIYPYRAQSTDVKAGSHAYRPIVPNNQHQATFYGLSKAAGVDMASSNNAVGTYTEEAKSAIKTMLGVDDPVDVQINSISIVNNGVANIPIATDSVPGVGRYSSGYGIAINPNNNGLIYIFKAADSDVKAGTNGYKPIVPSNQHLSAFYGLAKAAGDTTQSASSNTVGNYTDNAKAAIKAMIGVTDSTQTVQVSGTDPVITAVANTRYICGEVTSLGFTPSATGICDVIFTSGSTVTVLTLPNTVRLPEWFDPTALDTNTTYEISITDGIYGAVMVWA